MSWYTWDSEWHFLSLDLKMVIVTTCICICIYILIWHLSKLSVSLSCFLKIDSVPGREAQNPEMSNKHHNPHNEPWKPHRPNLHWLLGKGQLLRRPTWRCSQRPTVSCSPGLPDALSGCESSPHLQTLAMQLPLIDPTHSSLLMQHTSLFFFFPELPARFSWLEALCVPYSPHSQHHSCELYTFRKF